MILRGGPIASNLDREVQVPGLFWRRGTLMFLLLFQDIGEFERVLVSAVARLGFSARRIP